MKRLLAPAIDFRPLLFRGDPFLGSKPTPRSGLRERNSSIGDRQISRPESQKEIQVRIFPQGQIKEGGKEIGAGFKDLGLGIGKGFQNMGRGIKKAWTGDSWKVIDPRVSPP